MSDAPSRSVSEEKPIRQIDFGKNKFITHAAPFTSEEKRKIAHEEAARDIEKTPEQLLVDIHDESLDLGRNSGESISRSIARLASLQLRQAQATDRLSERIATLTWVILFLTLVGAGAACLQAYYAYQTANPAKESTSSTT